MNPLERVRTLGVFFKKKQNKKEIDFLESKNFYWKFQKKQQQLQTQKIREKQIETPTKKNKNKNINLCRIFEQQKSGKPNSMTWKHQ